MADLRDDLLSGIGVPDPKPFVPDPFQLKAIAALAAGHDVLVIAPTGAGKTYVAVRGIEEVVSRGERAVYTAPLKALSNAKYTEFKQRFEPRYTVGLLTGDRKIEGDSQIVVATTEIYRNELYSSRDHYGLVVLDELHYLADAQRGAVWEESIILSARSSRLLMLSASISNPDDVADWIRSIRCKDVVIVSVKERPVPLRYAFFHPDDGILPLEDSRGEVLAEVAHFYNSGGHKNWRDARRGERFDRPRRGNDGRKYDRKRGGGRRGGR